VPPNVERAYLVQIKVKDEQGQFRWIYSFRYLPDASGKGGYINFPGSNEPELVRQNNFVIIRSYAAPWVYASAEWDASARRVLKENGVSLTPSTLPDFEALFNSNAMPRLAIAGALILLGSLALISMRMRSRIVAHSR
jgi:hypothetical protein